MTTEQQKESKKEEKEYYDQKYRKKCEKCQSDKFYVYDKFMNNLKTNIVCVQCGETAIEYM